MTDSIYLVIRDLDYDQNWPEKAFESEDDAHEWRDKRAEEYDTVTDGYGSEFLIDDGGGKFRLRVKEVEYVPIQP